MGYTKGALFSCLLAVGLITLLLIGPGQKIANEDQHGINMAESGRADGESTSAPTTEGSDDGDNDGTEAEETGRKAADATTRTAPDARPEDPACIDPSLLGVNELNPLERRQLIEWFEREGHFGEQIFDDQMATTDPFLDYESYDDSALKQLADGGDPKAHLLLANRLMRQRDIDSARPHLREAVLLGYTAPLLMLGILHFVPLEQDEMSDDEWELAQHEAMIQDQAHVELYARLGGPLGDWLTYHNADTRNANPRIPTEADMEVIHLRADELEAELRSARKARGIRTAENARPPVADVLDADIQRLITTREQGVLFCR